MMELATTVFDPSTEILKNKQKNIKNQLCHNYGK